MCNVNGLHTNDNPLQWGHNTLSVNQYLFRNKLYITGVSKVANAIPKLTP